jgi:SAM-dependent methyltransferase
MGYTPDYFNSHVARWLAEGYLPPGGRLLDFGSQELVGDAEEIANCVKRFLREQGSAARAISPDGRYYVAKIFEAIGIRYHSIDVDEQFGALFFDLNTFRAPEAWIGQFDFVNNEGTIEHLINPINGFHVAHDVLKVGGVARHSVPLTGWQDHGFMYPTTKFYACLMGANRYEPLQAHLEPNKVHGLQDDPTFTVKPASGPAFISDIWLHLTYRKVHPDPFQIPADHLFTPDADKIAKRLSANFASYARSRLFDELPALPLKNGTRPD